MSAGLVDGIDHVSVLVADTNRALEFYRDVLGMDVDDKRPELAYPGAFLNLGDGRQIHLIELPNPDPLDGRPAHGGRDRHTALRIHSLDQMIARLEAAKIAYTLSSSGRRALFCRDFDGNAYELVEG
ncbi:MAG: VOC family protein [Thiotrichales bacterium]|nr:MAG: VOC family protein [Thiotrichales bacterium]